MKINRNDPPPFAAPKTQGTAEVHLGKWAEPFEGVWVPSETCYADPFNLHGPYTDAAASCKNCKSRKHRFDKTAGPWIPCRLVEQRREIWRHATKLAGDLALDLPWLYWESPEFQAVRSLVEGQEDQVITLVTSPDDISQQIAYDFVTNSYRTVGELLRPQLGIAVKRPELAVVRSPCRPSSGR